MVSCVGCGSALEVPQDVMYGEVLDCMDCGIELVVMDTENLKMKVVETTEEDWGE